MCGICGVISASQSDDNLQARVKTMAAKMVHRGPDGDGYYVSRRVAFGHRRLSIIDISDNGKQPMSDESGKYWITFNGEIYNYLEIKNKLKGKYHFKSNTDTEVIIYAYKEWGAECVKKFRGMFAFAIHDVDKEMVFMARDHFGQKPFYYYIEGDELYFASDVNALTSVLNKKFGINYAALNLFFLHNYRNIPDPHSIYFGIYKMPPASYMLFDLKTSRASVSRYWIPDYTKKVYDREIDLYDEYRELIRECTLLSKVSDVPIGLLLSGGVDSSTIAAMMKNFSLDSFAAGSGEQDIELQRAKKVANMFKTNHHELIFSAPKFEDAENLVEYLGEPLNLLSAIFSQSIASQASAMGIKVLLGGNGADEIFYGYDGSNRLLIFSKFLRTFNFSGRFINNIKGNIYRRSSQKIQHEVYSKRFSNLINKQNEGDIIDAYCRECNSPDYVEKSYYAGLMSENQHSVTIIADLTGMMNSLEIRTPFLDPKMFEFAARLPLKYKIGSWHEKKFNKYIMRKSMEGILPDDILYGSKMGFGYNFSLADLIRTSWKDKTKEYVFSDQIKNLNIFDYEAVEKKWQEHIVGRKNHSPFIWAMTTFGMWLKKNEHYV